MFEVERMSVRTRTMLASAVRRTREWLRSVAAIGPDDDVARRFAAFGAGSCITFPPGPIFGEAHIRIGRDTLIGPDVGLTAGLGAHIAVATGAVVRIGDRCNIGRGSHIVGLQSIEIGDDVTTGPYVYITDHNHDYADPAFPVARQWLTQRPVRIGNGSWLGAHAVVLPGATLGRNVVVAASSVVRGDVPDHSVVAGVPAKVVRRHDGTQWHPQLSTLPADGSEAPAGWWD